MSLPRVAAVYVSAAVFSLFACSDSDTILALNISAADDVGDVSKLHVRVTQAGQTPVDADIVPPKRDVEGGKAIASRFYERITLPESWTDGEVSVDVDAYDPDGVLFLEPEPVKVEIEDEGATAVFVNLAREPVPPEGGAGGAGGESGDGGVPGTGGTGGTSGGGGAPTGGTGTGDAGAPTTGGTDGTGEAGAGGSSAGAGGSL